LWGSFADGGRNSLQDALNGFRISHRNFGGLFCLLKLFPGRLKFQFGHPHLHTSRLGLRLGFGSFCREFPKPASFGNAFSAFLHNFKRVLKMPGCAKKRLSAVVQNRQFSDCYDYVTFRKNRS